MELWSNDELKETNIKNGTCYHFDDRTKIEDFDLDNTLIDEKFMTFYTKL